MALHQIIRLIKESPQISNVIPLRREGMRPKRRAVALITTRFTTTNEAVNREELDDIRRDYGLRMAVTQLAGGEHALVLERDTGINPPQMRLLRKTLENAREKRNAGANADQTAKKT